jgi:hypothetical protein
MSALWGYTKSKTAGNAYANNWGMSTNCAGMSSDAMMQTAQNVMLVSFQTFLVLVLAIGPDVPNL